MKKIRILLLLIFSSFLINATAQKRAPHLRISLLTCAPGDELYSTFGHTAFRITDSTTQADIVFNYGTFDFDDPDFYMKFTRGKLDYMLSVSTLQQFMYEYQSENRDVTEQVLNLSDSEKISIQKALTDNLMGPSRFYKYDFLYNNCTTRARDILLKYAGLRSEKILVPANTSFRNMLYEYLDKGAHPWSKLGIDLLLGSPIDKIVNVPQSMFLPDYLMKGVDSSRKLAESPLVSQKILLNKGTHLSPKNVNWPLYLFGAFALVIAAISFLKKKIAKNISKFFDTLLFLLTGLIGCLLLFMWFGTDHKSCAANYNLLWALPTNVIVALFVWKNPKWLYKYFTASAVIYAATLVFWFWLPQQLNTGFIPITALLLFRTIRLRKN